MDENVIRVSESALKAVLLVFDAIEEADKGYQACQCSTFRAFVDIRQEAAQPAYEEIRKTLKKPLKKRTQNRVFFHCFKQQLFADTVYNHVRRFTDKLGGR